MKIIAHRGASGYAPENTLAAFEHAVKMGARNFEFDLHMTKDGKLVVHHDFDLQRMAGIKAKIADLDYKELSTINVARSFKPDYPFQKVPLLDEVMQTISPVADWINFEIKNDGNVYPGIEKALLDHLRQQHGLLEKAIFSSFDYGTLKRLRALAPTAQLAYLGHNLKAILLVPAILRAKAINAVNFHMSIRIAFSANVALAKKAGFKVMIYTVNKRADALRMQKIGVDGIFTNFPDIMDKQ